MWLINLSFWLLFHPLHVSVTEADYSAKNKSIQITSRIFIDDLELSIKNQNHLESLDLLEPKNGMTTDQLVQAYLQEHIRIRLDGKLAKIKYLTHEVEDPALLCYLEIENVKKFKIIEITNSLIQETHDDQSNLFHVTYKGCGGRGTHSVDRP